MISSDTPYYIVPTLSGSTRYRMYAAIDNLFPVLENSVSVSNTLTPIIQIGFSVSRLWLTLSAQQTQFIRIRAVVNSIDLSAYLVGNLSIEWPDESGGSGRISFISQNPFEDTANIDTERLIELFVTLMDPSTGETVTVQIFKGRIVQFDYNPDTDIAQVSFQDMSRDVSHDTSRLNREILGVDPIRTEKISCAVANQISTTQEIDIGQPTPILGIWLESDTVLANNLTDQGDYTLIGNRTISFFTGGLINPGSTYVIRYMIPLGQFTAPTLTKSQLIEFIANLSGIQTLEIQRAGASEDEVVGVNITANNELPLDLIRKIVVPQTWKVEYNEFGDLVVRRELLKAADNADFTFDESQILEGSVTLTKDIDSVINEIRVAGILKRLGQPGSII